MIYYFKKNHELNKKLEILETLEILKKHYIKDSLLVSLGHFISFYIDKDIDKEDNDFNKIKEWLEDDK